MSTLFMGYTLPSIIKRFNRLFILIQISLTIDLHTSSYESLKNNFWKNSKRVLQGYAFSKNDAKKNPAENFQRDVQKK